MTTPRQERLTPDELALKLASSAAIKAAGGQVFLEEQLGRPQSRFSDWGSRNTRVFMPIDVAAKVDALGTGSPGAPHIAHALARAQGLCLPNPEEAPAGCDSGQLSHWLGEVAGESSDVIRALATGLILPGAAAASIRDMTAERRALLGLEIDQLIDVLAGLNAELHRHDGGADSS